MLYFVARGNLPAAGHCNKKKINGKEYGICKFTEERLARSWFNVIFLAPGSSYLRMSFTVKKCWEWEHDYYIWSPHCYLWHALANRNLEWIAKLAYKLQGPTNYFHDLWILSWTHQGMAMFLEHHKSLQINDTINSVTPHKARSSNMLIRGS